jgi:hypothetical protein
MTNTNNQSTQLSPVKLMLYTLFFVVLILATRQLRYASQEVSQETHSCSNSQVVRMTKEIIVKEYS